MLQYNYNYIAVHFKNILDTTPLNWKKKEVLITIKDQYWTVE